MNSSIVPKILIFSSLSTLLLICVTGNLHLFVSANAASVASAITLPYNYTFSQDGTLHEAGTIDESSSPYWWVNSGAYLKVANGSGATVMGELPALASWRTLYAKNNPIDTDNGYHPQNIFRLLTRTKLQDVTESAYFKIEKTNLSSSTNRNASNGLLLFSRYVDGNNLYYLGVRVDGIAVIKKKRNGTYSTLAQKKVFPGVWNVNTNPNLLPPKTWIGIKAVTKNEGNGVRLTLYTDVKKTGIWTEVLSVFDDGVASGSSAVTAAGYGGMRTDFMDVSFDDYKLTAIPK